MERHKPTPDAKDLQLLAELTEKYPGLAPPEVPAAKISRGTSGFAADRTAATAAQAETSPVHRTSGNAGQAGGNSGGTTSTGTAQPISRLHGSTGNGAEQSSGSSACSSSSSSSAEAVERTSSCNSSAANGAAQPEAGTVGVANGGVEHCAANGAAARSVGPSSAEATAQQMCLRQWILTCGDMAQACYDATDRDLSSPGLGMSVYASDDGVTRVRLTFYMIRNLVSEDVTAQLTC